jgi:hypothetical protein
MLEHLTLKEMLEVAAASLARNEIGDTELAIHAALDRITELETMIASTPDEIIASTPAEDLPVPYVPALMCAVSEIEIYADGDINAEYEALFPDADEYYKPGENDNLPPIQIDVDRW